jgi:4-carboxymuconolactone decarboxylase
MPSAPRDTYQAGLQVRRETLGDEHVDRSLGATTDFTRPMQELVTRYCWGEIWARPGLDRRSRSLLNLGMLTALGRTHELGLHIRGAINNGLSVAEIQEALLQTAIYCGVPAAMTAFRVAEGVLSELEPGQ